MNRPRLPLYLTLAALVCLCLPTLAHAQPRGKRHKAVRDKVAQSFYPPELVMRHQDDINLRGSQAKKMKAEMESFHKDTVALQFELATAFGTFEKAIKARTVDESATLAAAQKVMDLETKVKRRHLQLLIRIKNLLSNKQKAQLDKLR